jgi:putative oxidoreductase
MNKPCSCCEKWSPYFLTLLRVVVAVLYMCHGSQKLFGYPGNHHAPIPLLSTMGIAGSLEFFGGLCVLLGLFTRPVALVLAVQMAIGYVMAHAVDTWQPFQLNPIWPIHNHGELHVIFCVVFLYLSAAGAGPLSLDNCRKGGAAKKNDETVAH